MTYGVQNGCRIECGYKTLEEAIEAVKSELTQYCRPTDENCMEWEDPVADRYLRIVEVDDVLS